ncbi:hypothetical protein EYE40_02850 [Glaciihabitans arcticus]|uniref:Uncharacterized protein n=1 Tax=Glaciihabitans arcticus TaxID=2668039 RepID=A0A4Q9GNQ5_9MICO|nr:hypothetical protein [Glaciihabitans arcticus]TBN56422.1 hypothetical protein EYE40_02850 [Glaciihabitans arcticus]
MQVARPEIESAPKRQHRFFAPIVIAVVALISGGLGLGFSLLGTAISSLVVSADPYEGLYDDDDYVEEEPKPGPTDDIDFMEYGEEQPLLSGDPAPPRAKVPTVCEWECFGYYALSAPSPSTIELENNGLVGVNEDNWWYGSVADAHAQGLDQWRASGSTPEQCFATAPLMPINLDISGEATPDREVLHTDPGHIDAHDTTTFVQSNRIFATSQLAESYLVQLDREIRGCTSFTGPDGRLNTVSLAPALEVPDSIGVVGWVVSSPDSRTYVFDLQRGNLVERTVMTSRQGMGEADFRAIVVGVATRIDKVHFDCENPECS